MAKHKTITLRGSFHIENNDFFYLPSLKENQPFTHRVQIDGKWRLDKNHNLAFEVSESYSKVFGNTIQFAAKIEEVSQGCIEFAVLQRRTPSFLKVKRICLNGFWKVNEANKIVFEVKRDKTYDELVFKNIWQINKANQIVYCYKRRFGKKEIINSFALSGVWDFERNALKFHVENSSTSVFSFEVCAQRQLIDPRKGKLDFTVGAAAAFAKGARKITKSLSLWGRWRLKGAKAQFAVFCQRQSLSWQFEISKELPCSSEVALRLINKDGRFEGYEVAIYKKFFEDKYFFIRGKSGKEKRIEAGAYWRF